MKRILLIEPSYRNKFPPLGLMKLSTYHKFKGDFVQFAKGCVPRLQKTMWNRIYISTLFTFYWKTCIDTINYYRKAVQSSDDIVVGGVMATLLSNDIRQETGVKVIPGLLDRPGILDPGDKRIIDVLTPDYHILEEIDYDYGIQDTYFGYATRGCPNRCSFCAVNHIEPEFSHYQPLKKQIQSIETLYGAKQHLMLMDNNVLASSHFERIINDIIDLGFEKDAKLNKKLRFVDFNQGIDIRRLTKKKMNLLAKIALRPLRLAFDHIELKDNYVKCVKMAVDSGITHLSNYVLYNYTDTPQDFYSRLRINVELNQQLGTQIYSFPMKYIPLNAKDRTYIGHYWNRRLIRGVQCILLATKGKVGTHLDFFEAAFGRSPDEFIEIAMMPEEYIINRRKHENNGAYEWRKEYRALTKKQRIDFMEIASDPQSQKKKGRFSSLLDHYNFEKE